VPDGGDRDAAVELCRRAVGDLVENDAVIGVAHDQLTATPCGAGKGDSAGVIERRADDMRLRI
jgi:hypothetical protein